MFNVGETIIWDSRTGAVECEYRGFTWGMNCKEGCVIVREEGSAPFQTMVPFKLLRKIDENKPEDSCDMVE